MNLDKKEIQKNKATAKPAKVAKEIKAKVAKRPIGMYQFAGAPSYWYNADGTDMPSIADPFLGSKGKKKRKHSPSYQMTYPGLIFNHNSRASCVPGQKHRCGLQHHFVPPIETTSH